MQSILRNPLTEYNWTIDQLPNEATIFNSDSLIEYKFKGPLIILTPVIRYNYDYLAEITKGQIIQNLSQYYRQPLTMEQLQQILKLSAMFSDSTQDYLDNSINEVSKGQIVPCYKLLSGLKYFEGLSYIYDNNSKLT